MAAWDSAETLVKVEDGEPYFLLRAQDVLAPLIVDEWCRLARLNGVLEIKVQAAQRVARAMEAWDHHRQKLPD